MTVVGSEDCEGSVCVMTLMGLVAFMASGAFMALVAFALLFDFALLFASPKVSSSL